MKIVNYYYISIFTIILYVVIFMEICKFYYILKNLPKI